MSSIYKKLRAGLHRRVDDLLHHYLFRITVQERLARKQFFYNAFRALSFNGIDGDYVEFGCYGARTFGLAYHEAIRHGHKAKLWAFDSFSGLPAGQSSKDSHPKWVKGELANSLDQFHKRCEDRGIPRSQYHVVPGYYDQSLPLISRLEGPSNIALAYIDCDLYSSTNCVLKFLAPRLKHGSIIGFDDWFCWSANQASGERLSFLENFCSLEDLNFVPYIQFGWHGQSFFLEDKRFTRGLPSLPGPASTSL